MPNVPSRTGTPKQPWIRVFRSGVSISDKGLLLGKETFLARMTTHGHLDLEPERVLALLSIAYRRPISPAVLRTIEDSALLWRRGEKVLANLRLVFAGLPGLDEPSDAKRVRMAEWLLDAGVLPQDLMKKLDLDAAMSGVAKYNPNQARVPAGNGRASGRWGDDGRHYGHAPDGTPIDPSASADDPQGLKMAADAARAAGLTTKAEKRAFHDLITGQGITNFQELVELAKSVKRSN